MALAQPNAIRGGKVVILDRMSYNRYIKQLRSQQTVKAFLLIGPPSSGKSTSISHERFQDCTPVSLDHFRLKVNGDEGSRERFQEVKRQFDLFLEELALSGVSVVVDNTNCNSSHRMDLIRKLRSLGYNEIVGVVFPRTPEECLELQKGRERKVPGHVITSMYRNLTQNPPTLEEGFDRLMSLIL